MYDNGIQMNPFLTGSQTYTFKIEAFSSLKVIYNHVIGIVQYLHKNCIKCDAAEF